MTALQPLPVFDSQRLEVVFNRCFAAAEHTVLCGGAAEPLYQPARGTDGLHRLFYREDYFASALHEMAHWCIAGEARRQQLDFGYWYAPEGRTAAQQRAFEAVEARPQALEWIFAQACHYRFRVSVDNFFDDGSQPQTAPFRRHVTALAQDLQRRGLPARACRLFRALAAEFRNPARLQDLIFRDRDIG